MSSQPCPCGSQQRLSHCCSPLISGKTTAKTAEQLMRSRFTAFYFNEFDYLINTHYPNKRASNERQLLEENAQATQWVELTVHKTVQGEAQDSEGVVEFSATFFENNTYYALHEVSQFKKDMGSWFYVDGQPSIRQTNPTFKRNSPCWCQSGKKYKHCHG